MMQTFGDLRVVISAAASGIGKKTAEVLSQAGARIFICDIDKVALHEMTSGLGIGGVLADVSVYNQAEAFIAAGVAELGGIDVLINNAGIAGPTARVEDISIEEWRKTLDINITGQFFCARAAVPHLKRSKRGQIINMSSVAGRLGYAYRTPYAASKWAVIGFTKSLAKELGPDGIRVNAILPGIVEGPRTDAVIRSRADALAISVEEMREQYLQKASMRTMIAAQDVADMIAFICSPMARFISGQTISVDGNVEDL